MIKFCYLYYSYGIYSHLIIKKLGILCVPMSYLFYWANFSLYPVCIYYEFLICSLTFYLFPSFSLSNRSSMEWCVLSLNWEQALEYIDFRYFKFWGRRSLFSVNIISNSWHISLKMHIIVNQQIKSGLAP